MRSEKEMYDLILLFAKNDERIRAVYLNGSKADSNVEKDIYQDYDIVYVVNDFQSFIRDSSWINFFGERLLLQTPEAMRSFSDFTHFTWLMLFKDGNRIDLKLIPVEHIPLYRNDSFRICLLDKDSSLPPFVITPDNNHFINPPTEIYYLSCCNNFWWCLQNVAKGIARNEIPYAMMMYYQIIHEELQIIISWYIGIQTKFQVSSGKMGKNFKKYLPQPMYKIYLKTFSTCDNVHLWKAIWTACDLFHLLALEVGIYFNYDYNLDEEQNMRFYLKNIQSKFYEI